MLKRLLLCLFLLMAAVSASATDYTDIWYIPAESGWGVNVVQSDAFLFVTFFIYGQNKQPTWYTAQLTLDASGNYNGTLYATTGTYYGMPWNPNDNPPATQVGTASFQPTSPYTAKLIYVVTNGPTVTKAIQRQALTAITIGGTYVGGQSGVYSGCNKSSDNGVYTDVYTLQVTQLTGGSVSFTFDYTGLQQTCTIAGTLTQFGQLYKIGAATYQCSGGLNTNASMAEIKATAQGIEGTFSSPTVDLGCREDAAFSAVLR